MNLFTHGSLLSRFFYLVGDIITLHFLWILCSLPIITIGASTTALYYSCMKRIRTKEGYPLKNFFSSFKINFKQSTLIWIGLMIIGFVFFTDFRIAMALENTLGRLMLVTCSCFLIPYLLICLYIFPVQANTIYDNLKNAFFMAIRHFPLTLLLIAIDATFILLFFSFVPFIGLALCCGVGLLGYLNANLFVFIFRKYVPDELEHDLEISGERF